MKIVQINATCGSGSTGVMVVEIAELLKKNGHEAYIAYGQGQSDYPNSYRIGSNFENKMHALLNTRILGEEGTGSVCATKRLVKWMDSINPDIVHLHTFHTNYINYEILFSYLKRKQISVCWSFFDCWPFTGGCTHFTENKCWKWRTECDNCEFLNGNGSPTWFFDKTKKMFNNKKRWLGELQDLNIIVCSEWLKSEVKRSFLKDRPVHMVYNWIDMTRFREIHDDSVYDRYGLDRSKKQLVSVSAGWDDKTTRYTDALRLAQILPDDYQLVIIGSLTSKRPLHKNMVHINFVQGTEELSKLYSTALAFVGFSVEDTFGKVFAETMLCGTPAVVFNATACPEVVGDTGYVVEPHNVHQMLDKVLEIDTNKREFYSEKCKSRVQTNYSYETNVNKYIQIYESIYIHKSVGSL